MIFFQIHTVTNNCMLVTEIRYDNSPIQCVGGLHGGPKHLVGGTWPPGPPLATGLQIIITALH